VLVIDKPLATKRLLLRPFTAGDLDDVAAYHALPEVVRYLYGEVRSREEVRDLLVARRLRHRLATDGDVAVLAAALAQTGRVIGQVTLTWTSVVHRQGEIGFVFHPDHHGHGYAADHFVQNEIFKGEWGDELVFAILDDEWRALRETRAAQGTGRSNQRTSQ
jgi:RimJ/RimL family protein N-acetyltransferase